MEGHVPREELESRFGRFRDQMDRDNPGWNLAAIFGRINLYYFSATIQDGMLLIPADGEPVLWVRRSYERALDESPLPDIREMRSYRDAAQACPRIPDSVHIEADTVPVGLLGRFRKYFPAANVCSLDLQVARTRSRKTRYELSLMERAGAIHEEVLEKCVPRLLSEGVSEAELGAEIYSLMVRRGHQGLVRFGAFNVEIEVGQIGFGENSLYPTCFDGPGGFRGLGPASPVLGSLTRKLTDGDLVFIDNSCGVEGYQTDKTMTYMFGNPIPQEAMESHFQCVRIENEVASLLKPGVTPDEVYTTVMGGLTSAFLENFMGFGLRRVNFLGHGVGLQVDEIPVIAKGFSDPLEEGMVIAVEPKKGIRGVGMVGIENTYIVTPSGGKSITGKNPGLIEVAPCK